MIAAVYDLTTGSLVQATTELKRLDIERLAINFVHSGMYEALAIVTGEAPKNDQNWLKKHASFVLMKDSAYMAVRIRTADVEAANRLVWEEYFPKFHFTNQTRLESWQPGCTLA